MATNIILNDVKKFELILNLQNCKAKSAAHADSHTDSIHFIKSK